MTQEEYLARNAKGFEGDEFVGVELKKLIDKFNVELVIELGSYRGYTARRLAEMAKEVITVEIVENSYKEVIKNISDVPNLSAIHSSSVDALPILLDGNKEKSILLFIDSHWEQYCPLLEELEIIAKSGVKPVLAIHDWKVPNRPELGYDSYNGQDFTFEWIKSRVDAIYGEGNYNYHFNGESEGAMRGVIYVYPLKNEVI